MDVELKFSRESREEDEMFVEEINFYTGMKAREQQKQDEYRRVLRSCDPTQMFDNLSELIENNEEQAAEMPVRKFYNNTFSTLLNRAIFALTKKQSQHPEDRELFTTQGMIKFVAFQLLDAPPDGEMEQNMDEEDTV